jgi:UDP-GlcNAc3NAcA epimerase
MPLHPRTKASLPKKVERSAIKFIEPVGYFDMLQLQHHCKLIVTDSGGIQKEAYFQRKFCVTLRDETEWVELVNNGFNFLVNAQSLRDTVGTVWAKGFTDNPESLYGKGDASNKITDILLQKLR